MSIAIPNNETTILNTPTIEFVKGSADEKVIEYWEAELPQSIQHAVNRSLELGRDATNNGYPLGSRSNWLRRVLYRLI